IPKIKSINFQHIYRERNEYCDELSNRYIEYLSDYGIDVKEGFDVKPYRRRNKRIDFTRPDYPVVTLSDDTTVTFGKHKGMKLCEIRSKYPMYIEWLGNQSNITLI